MASLAGLIAVLGAFSVGPAVIYVRARFRLQEKRLELEAKTGSPKLLEENRLLRERVENLESIVCSVDFELNQKFAKLIDEQRSVVPAALPAGEKISPAPNSKSEALDRTATAQLAKPQPLTT